MSLEDSRLLGATVGLRASEHSSETGAALSAPSMFRLGPAGAAHLGWPSRMMKSARSWARSRISSSWIALSLR